MDYIKIPLRNRKGPEQGWTIIDMADYEQVIRHNWFKSDTGYAVRNDWDGVAGKNYRPRLHRVLMGLERGDPREVDHINGDPLDNRRGNLRIVTHAQNLQNMKPRAVGSGSSKYPGVSWESARGKWKVQVRIQGKNTCIGRFVDEDEAGAVAAEARRKYMPYARELSTGTPPVPYTREDAA